MTGALLKHICVKLSLKSTSTGPSGHKQPVRRQARFLTSSTKSGNLIAESRLLSRAASVLASKQSRFLRDKSFNIAQSGLRRDSLLEVLGSPHVSRTGYSSSRSSSKFRAGSLRWDVPKSSENGQITETLFRFGEEETRNKDRPRIVVVGVGGGGAKALAYIAKAANLEGVELIVIDTDKEAVESSPVQNRLLIGGDVTEGKGTEGRTDLGAASTRSSGPQIQTLLRGANLVFVVAGLGRGTGTGGAPVVAQLAQAAGALTIGLVTTPLGWEGPMRGRVAEYGVSWMTETTNTLVVIEGSRLPDTLAHQVGLQEAFRIPNEGLLQGIKGIIDIIAVAGASTTHMADVRLDLADVRAVMEQGGRAMLGYGVGQGPKRAEEAAKEAVSLLLESGSARPLGVLYNITCGPDITLTELEGAASIVQSIADPNALMFYGQVIDPSCEGEVRITLVATRFQGLDNSSQRLDYMSEDELGDSYDVDGRFYSSRVESQIGDHHEASRGVPALEVPNFLQKANQEKREGFWRSLTNWLVG